MYHRQHHRHRTALTSEGSCLGSWVRGSLWALGSGGSGLASPRPGSSNLRLFPREAPACAASPFDSIRGLNRMKPSSMQRAGSGGGRRCPNPVRGARNQLIMAGVRSPLRSPSAASHRRRRRRRRRHRWPPSASSPRREGLAAAIIMDLISWAIEALCCTRQGQPRLRDPRNGEWRSAVYSSSRLRGAT